MTEPPRPRSSIRTWPFLCLALALLALALLWQSDALRAHVQPLALVQAWRGLAAEIGWPGVLVSFVLACTAAVPLSLLTVLAVLAFEPWAGALLAWVGASLSACLPFAAGRGLGRPVLEAWAGPRLRALNALAERRGILAVVAVRLVPAAPFAVVNLLLGATRIGWGALLIGNALGMLPMLVATAWLAPHILAQLQQPSGLGWAALAGIVGLVIAASWGLRRWAGRL